MKNLKIAIAIIVISLSSVGVISANNTEPTKGELAKTALRAKIVKLLGNYQYNLKDHIFEAEVAVMLNSKNELVVVSVESDFKQVESFVTTKLNYKKVNIEGITSGTIYRVPVKIK
uniref:hypothetical protein n=1 Tax=Polaribacter sp. TaxID=1920175 RepID=UPI004048B92D